MTREEAIETIRKCCPRVGDSQCDFESALRELIPDLKESEDGNLKNKSGYYKAGKFWKASTLWNATKDKIPQRVPNMYILQECVWNIGTLKQFANEVKNVQEVSLDYPIILDMNGNILDGAHRVVKAYLEGKDIDIVYLGDDEWPEPDYDEEKAVKKSEDERIRNVLLRCCDDWDKGQFGCMAKEDVPVIRAYLEKQKEPHFTKRNALFDKCVENCDPAVMKKVSNEVDKMLQKKQKLAEWSEEDERMLSRCMTSIECSKDFCVTETFLEAKDKEKDWLKSLPERFNLRLKQETHDYLTPHKEFFQWIYDRLVHVHKENPDVDYMRSFKERIDNLSFEDEHYWKPSEEQMGALNYAYCELFKREDVDHNILGPLRNLIDILSKL